MRPSFITLVLTSFLIFTSKIQSQERYIEKDGVLIFEASEKLFEEVKATNGSVTAIYDPQTNKIAALALVKGFHFKNSLMEEHFNENYIESEQYPKATFKGKLLNDAAALSDNSTTEMEVQGTLKLHGKEKKIQTVLNVQKIGDIISMTGDFKVTPQDFDIKIPKIVENKIAKEVHVKIDFKLAKK